MTPTLRVVRGILWAGCGVGGGRLLAFAMMMALARLLTPTDFGLMASALVFITYLEMIGDLGAAAALVYWPGREDEAAPVSFFLSIAMGWMWFGVTIALAPLVATLFHNPQIEAILRALAWSFPLKGLGTTPDALCQKNLRFGRRLISELTLAGMKAVVAIALAWRGFGVWSLVWGQLAGLAAWTIALWIIVGWRPRWGMTWDLLPPMLKYGFGVVGINVMAGVLYQADLVIIGGMAGASALGIYQLAYKIPEVLLALPIRVAGQVLFPAFARFRQDGGPRDLERAYLTAMRYGSLVTWPTMAALVVFAPYLVRTAFGNRWAAAIPLVRVLAVHGLMRSLAGQAGDVLRAIGRPGLLVGIGAIRAVLLVPALVIAGSTGSTLAIASTLAAMTVVTTLLTHAVLARVTGMSLVTIAAQLRPGVAAAAVFMLVAAGGQYVLGAQGTLRIVPLALLACVGAAVTVSRVHPGLLSVAATSLLDASRRHAPDAHEARPSMTSPAAAA